MSSIWTIRRSATDTKLTGLCAGVAQHWGVDPVLIRVGWVLLALSGGIGLVLYLAGWLLIPIEGSEKAPVDDFFGSTGRRWSREVWIALIVVACLVVFGLFGSVSPFGVAPAVVLAVIWYFGFYKNRSTTAHGPGADSGQAPAPHAATLTPPPAPPEFFRYPGPPTPFTEAADAWRHRIEQNARQAAAQQAPVHPALVQQAPPRPAPAPQDRSGTAEWPTYPGGAPTSAPLAWEPDPDPAVADRNAFLASPDPVGLYAEPPASATTALVVKRSQTVSARRLRLVALIVLGLTLAGLGIADGQGVTVSLAAYLGAALLVIGLTLVAATWLGRARGLLPIGLLLAIGLLATSAVGQVTQQDDFNPAPKVYAQVADLPAGGDTWDVGNYTVDLSQLKITDDVAYRVHLDAGRLAVIVPAGVNVRTQYTVDAGVVEAYGQQLESGTDLRADQLDPAVPNPNQPTLTLDVSVDVGNVEVRR